MTLQARFLQSQPTIPLRRFLHQPELEHLTLPWQVWNHKVSWLFKSVRSFLRCSPTLRFLTQLHQLRRHAWKAQTAYRSFILVELITYIPLPISTVRLRNRHEMPSRCSANKGFSATIGALMCRRL